VIDARFFRCAPLSPLPFQVMLNGIFIACPPAEGIKEWPASLRPHLVFDKRARLRPKKTPRHRRGFDKTEIAIT